MNNKVKILVASLLVVTLGAGATAYLGQQNLEQREVKILNMFNELSKSMPPNIKKENKIEKGLFSSTGVYSASYTEAGKTNGFVLNYKLDHGLGSWFGDDIKFESTLDLQGELAKNIKLGNPNLLQMTGNIKEDGSFDLVGTGSKIMSESKKDSMSITLEPSKLIISYNQISKDFKSEMTFPVISLNSKNNINIVKDFRIGRNFNGAYPEMGSFYINVAEVNDKIFNIKDINFLIDSNLNKEKIDAKFAVSAKSISFVPMAQKDIEVDIAYSIKGIDKIILEIYKDFYNNPGRVISKEDNLKYKEKFKQILKSGLLLSIDKFNVKSTKGLVNFAASVKILPSSEIALQKNTLINFNLLIGGEFAQMFAQFTPENKKQFIVLDDKNNIKVDMSYENNIIKLNGQNIPEEEMSPITGILIGLDNALKK